MSLKKLQDNSKFNRTFTQDPPSLLTPWVRNPSWLTLPSIATNESKFIGLFAVYPDMPDGDSSNFLRFSVANNFTVDWGDGSATENIAANGTASHTYNYNDVDLANTNAPVTLTDSGDKVERTAHGYSNGMTVQFYNIVSTTGITEGRTYYVINANANDFQISTTPNGSAVTLTTNGSATLLKYKQAIVTITPQAGQNLITIDLARSPTTKYGWLDIKLGSPNLTSMGIVDFGLGDIVVHSALEQIEITQLPATFSAFYTFSSLPAVRKITFPESTYFTDLDNAFAYCYSLEKISNFNLNNSAYARSMQYTFLDCYNLQSIPLLNTANVTNMTGLFQNCNSLKNVPLLNTANVTNMISMFSGCSSLESVPSFNTSKVTSMSAMFSGCTNLKSVPLFDTSKVVDFSYMFSSCYNLTYVPNFNTTFAQDTSGMFFNCTNLTSVPEFQFSNFITYMNAMFSGCFSLRSIPFFKNTIFVNEAFEMFKNCFSLVEVPPIDFTNCYYLDNMFYGCFKLKSAPIILPTEQFASASYMFYNCISLNNLPNLSGVYLGDARSLFVNCQSLQYMPYFNVGSPGSSISAIFQNCYLANIDAYGASYTHSLNGNNLSKQALKKYMDNLGTVVLTNTNLSISFNFGSGPAYAKTVSSTAQSTTVTCTNTSGLASGMMVTGNGTGTTTPISVTSNVTTNTLSFTSHGLISGTKLSFDNVGTTVNVNRSGIYYPVNINANDFQISTLPTGAAVDLTGTNSTMRLRYASYIQSIVTNTSITLDVPASSGVTNGTWTFRDVDAYGALLRGWTVSF